MKSSIKGLFVILAIVMSLVVVQSVCAQTLIEGSIKTISTQPNMIVVWDGIDKETAVEVYGVKFNYLSNKEIIDLKVGDYVSVDVYEYVCSDGTIKLKACEITLPGYEDPIFLRPCQ